MVDVPAIREMVHEVRVQIDLDRCIGCGLCTQVCPVDNFEIREVDGAKKAFATEGANERCFCCKACEVVCPTQAVVIFEGLK